MNQTNFRLSVSYLTFYIAIAIATANPALAEVLNVSKIVTGVHTPTPSLGFIFPNGTPSAVVTHVPMVHAKTGADSFEMYPGGWAPWAAASSNPSIKRQVNSPAPSVADSVTTSYHREWNQLAQAGMTPQVKQATVAAVFKNGSALASTSYALNVEHIGAVTSDYFLNLSIPEVLRFLNPAYRLEPGSNGGTYVFYAPASARSRSAVDVYVDGLPVWSTESTYMFPDSDNPFAKIENKWGNAQSPQSGNAILYLGRLGTGKSFRISMVVRTEAFSGATYCGSETSWGFRTMHCFDLSERVLLPVPANSQVPGMSLFSKSALVYRAN
ncbi:MAG: hypothetical protein H7039_24805 [Bryobacteraceae bacterium]|nr:hypothetical protein [Bryobacteraceae bacterium]